MKWLFRIVGGLVALLTVATLVLLALGQRNGAGDIRVSTDINASPERIWPWLDDGEHAKQWVTWLVEVRSDPAAKQKPVGAKEVWVMRDENNGGPKDRNYRDLHRIYSVLAAECAPFDARRV